MPWKPGDARSHTKKARTPAQRRQWSTVANKILKQTGNEGRAIRVANAVLNRQRR